MPSKENYCYRILKTYSLIVDFDGEPSRETVPAPVEGETYGRWQERVLGDSVSNVVLYAPKEPAPANQTRISTLQNKAGANHLEKMFSSFEKIKNNQKNTAVKAAIEKTGRTYTSFSKKTLEDIIACNEVTLELSVEQFIDRFLNSTDSDIDTEELIKALLKAYNGVVRECRAQYNRHGLNQFDPSLASTSQLNQIPIDEIAKAAPNFSPSTVSITKLQSENSRAQQICCSSGKVDMNDLRFESFVSLMGLNEGDVPSVRIEDRIDEIPEWIIAFVNDFVEEQIDSDVQVGLLDILGTYNSASKQVTVYRKLIEKCARRLRVDSQTLEDVVIAHELAHAATHLGIERTGEIWGAFGSALSDVKEYFAQWYAHTFWSRQGCQSHENLMLTLADVQPKKYGAYRQDLLINLATMNSRLLFERHKSVESGKQELCEFCKIRIATEQVERLDTWQAWGKQSWSIPACSVCAPHHQQTWMT